MSIRAATLQDLDLILRIHRDVLFSGAGPYSPDELEKWAQDLSPAVYEAAINEGQVFVAVDNNGRVKGFSQFDPNEGVIAVTCVAVPHQGQGVGRELVRQCLARARKAHLEVLRVAASLGAAEFYKSLDFESGGLAAKVFADGATVALRTMSRPVTLPVILEHAEALRESVEFFAPGKDKNYEKELIVVQALLRGLGIEFKEEELTRGDDPPDVCYGAGRFEVKALYDEKRRMHKEYKDELEKVRAAFFSSDLVEVFTPRDIEITDVIRRVIEVVVDKGAKYSFETRKQLDFVVYVNLRHIWEIKSSPWPDLAVLEEQGWRSVSFTYGIATSCVVTATKEAPHFLRRARGKLLHGLGR
jgi:ribosomal protein S18 acetylase RimI-like enzyme